MTMMDDNITYLKQSITIEYADTGNLSAFLTGRHLIKLSPTGNTV